MAIAINQLFDQIYKVPQVPEVVRTLIVQMNDPNIDMDAIAKNVEKEQTIALKVLRIVNSAHFGLSRKMGSINDAVVMMGMAPLKTLVIASGMVGAIPDIPNFDVKKFWGKSFKTATYAKWFAAEANLDADMAFTAGLIGGLGKALIYLGAPEEASEIEQHVEAGNSRRESEEKYLGFTNQDVAAELCRRWHFPEELVTTIAQSGKPLEFEEISRLSCVIYLARYLSASQSKQISEDEILKEFPIKELKKLDLNLAILEEKLPEILALESGLEAISA
jgi:HD-like signal output (HDOD) protein